MNALLQKWITFLSMLFLVNVSIAGAKNVLDEIEGVYVAPGNAKYQKCQDCEWVPVEHATDCLVIKKLSNKTASVYLRTVQSIGHSCTIEEDYTFIVKGNALFFQDKEMQLEKDSDGIYVIKDKGKIKFNVQPRRVESMYMGCGSSASLEGLTFKLSQRRTSWIKQNKELITYNKFNLSQYCPVWGSPYTVSN